MPLAKRGIAPVVDKPVEPGIVTTSDKQPENVMTQPVPTKRATTDSTMSKADWAEKDTRISRQGLFQAALQSTGLLQLNVGNTLEDYLKLVEQAAERGLLFVNKK